MAPVNATSVASVSLIFCFLLSVKDASIEDHPQKVAAKRKMTTRPVALPCVAYEWDDSNFMKRIHLFVHMPSGTQPGSHSVSSFRVEGGELIFNLTWPRPLSDPTRMFGHSRFEPKFHQAGSAKVQAMVKTTNSLAASEGCIQSEVKISLPSADFRPTPCEHSGHDWFIPIQRAGKDNLAETVIFYFFDLVKGEIVETKPISKRKVATKDYTFE